jgi:hypothetical protein
MKIRLRMTISLRIKMLAVKALQVRIILWISFWKKLADKALRMKIKSLVLITGPCG